MDRTFKVVVLLDISRGYEREFFIGISRFLSCNQPWNIYRPDPQYIRTGRGKGELDLIKKWNADGIVMREPEKIDDILSLELPTAIIPYKERKFHENVNVVRGNSRYLGEIAAEHFLEKKYRNFAFCGYDNMEWSLKRAQGFCTSVQDAGFSVHVFMRPKNKKQQLWHYEQNQVLKWLKSLPKPVGLFACTDDRSIQIAQMCAVGNILVPEEVAILGVDNDMLICDTCNPPLSSIELNIQKAGYEAAKALTEIMSGVGSKGKQIFVEPIKIVQRKSTDIFFSEDEDVKKALYFIRQNADKPMKVSDVIDATMVSRRSLYEKFKKIVGRGINEEIRRVRIEKVATMLTDTDLTVSEIAYRLNYLGPDHISRYFKIEKGTTPVEFRRKYSKRI